MPKYIDQAQLEYQARNLASCSSCGAEAGKICMTMSGNIAAAPHANRRRTESIKKKTAAQIFDDGSGPHKDEMCPAQMHNLSNNNIWHHDCWLPLDHEGYHECHHHNRQIEKGCLWVTGKFVRDMLEEESK